MILYEMVYQSLPFVAGSKEELMVKIKKNKINYGKKLDKQHGSKYYNQLKDICKQILKDSLKYEEKDRISWNDLFTIKTKIKHILTNVEKYSSEVVDK